MTFCRAHFLSTLLLAGTFALAGCNKNQSSADSNTTNAVIKIGEYASLTGEEATFGISSHEGTLMAIEEINAAGGLLGRKVELITEDDQCKPGESATVVNKLISRDEVIAVLGEVASTRSMEAAKICQDNHVPMISPSSTNPDVTKTGDYIFRVCFIDPFQGTVMANFAATTLKLKRVAVFTDVKSDYSKGLAKFFKERFVANGGTIVTELEYNGGDKDFKAQLTTIKGANPDGVFVPGYYTECALIALQAHQLGLTVPLFGGDGWESAKLLEIGGEAVEGDYLSTHYNSAVGTDVSKNFVANFSKRWQGQVPDALAACGYDSAIVLADAIKRAGSTDPQKLRDAIAATRNFAAVTGNISIDENRNATKSAVILQVKGGKFQYLETVEP
jgi:branched-chain amino acid transport system substrate-binding protein